MAFHINPFKYQRIKTTYQFFSILFFGLILAGPAWSQSKVATDTLTVTGICDMCQKRIEKAAFVKGVKWAEWDKNTQQLVVIYRSKKTDLDQIASAVADAGHDNARQKAPDEAYAKLPDCCAYRDGVEVH